MQLCGAEMCVHGLGTAQEGIKGLGANGNHQRQANRSPDGIAPSYPILEPEDAGRINTEGGSFVCGCAEGGKLGFRITTVIEHPSACRARVCHCLDGGEGFGRDNDQCGLRVQPAQRVGNIRTIDVRDEIAAWPVMIG